MGKTTEDDRHFPFTKPRLMALPPPEKGYVEYFDTYPGVHGLILVVTWNRAKTFYAKRRVDGVPKRIKVGPFPDLSVENARSRAAEINGDIARGIDPTAKTAALKEEPTFSELFELYLASPRKRGGTRSDGTIKDYRGMVDRYMKSYRNRKVSFLTFDAMSELHASVGEKHGHYAANRLHAMVKAVYNFGIDRKKLKIENPATGIVVFPEQARERRLFDDEVPRLFKALGDEPDRDIRDFVYLALLTGARKSNVLAMRWEDVLPLERGLWRIAITKNGDPQLVPLMPEAVEILQERLDARDGKFVFPGTGRTGHLVDPKKIWATVLEKAGIEDFRVHDLRRTHGSYQGDVGVSLETIGKTLNHKSLLATKIYARICLNPVREAMKAGTGAMFLAGGKPRQAGNDPK